MTNINGGTLALSGGSGNIALSAGVSLNASGTTFSISDAAPGTHSIQTLAGVAGSTVALGTQSLALTNASTTYGGSIGGLGGLTLTAGTEILSGTNSYTGATTIDGGTLVVNGSLTGTSGVTVAAGGTLSGTGLVDPLTVAFANGATFTPGTAGVPGTSMTIVGNLVLNPGANYAVYLNPTTSTFATIQGTATLTGATAVANFAAGNYVFKHYTILTTTGGLGGTTFASLTNVGLSSGASDSLSYNADDVFLNLSTPSSAFTGLNINQQNVANALTSYFNTTGGIPGQFFNLTPSGLTQIDGENSTGAEHAAFELTNEFLGLMLDPFVYGRGGPASGGGPLGFAPDQQASFPPDVALAYAGLLKAPPKQSFDQRWTVWGSGFGGSGSANGDPAIGSNNVTTSTYGFAAGADYHVSPDTVLGFALAGSGTNWNLAQALGTGRSDAFQAGVYGTKYFGPAYIGAALAFTNNWFTTNRTALGDQLTANFQGQSFGVRVESGYRYAVAPAAGVTPYAAIQAQSFHTPTYSETDLTGGGFGLSYNAMSATDTRSELGGRFDTLTAWGAMPVQLRARVAWAHDWVSNPALSAAFQALPGTSFVVNGAQVPHDSALTSVGAEMHLTSRWTLLGKFDGEFASSSQLYAGSGTLRYVW
jgi:autotransporter-associated beta strand protein